MAILNQKRILNLIPKTSAPVTIHVSQGDVGTEIEFTLVKGDELFVNTGNLTASMHGVREDGANFGAFACTLSGSSVKFPLHSEMTMVKGSAIAEIVLVDSQGNKVGSANFGIMVEESVFPLGVTYDNDVSIYESILAYVQTIPAQVTQDYNTKINAETAARQAADSSLNEALMNEANARQSADNALGTRIDEIIAPSGEAPSAAEVADARIGANGTTYASLGTAIRTQVSYLDDELKNVYHLKTQNLEDVDSNVLFASYLEEVFGTGNYANRDVYRYNGTISSGDVFSAIVGSVEGSTNGGKIYVYAYNGSGTEIRHVNTGKLTIVDSDITSGIASILFRLYPASGSAMSTGVAKYNNLYIVKGNTVGDITIKGKLKQGIENIIEESNLTNYDSNVLYMQRTVSVEGTDNYVRTELAKYTGQIAEGDTFTLLCDSVVGATADSPLYISVCNGDSEIRHVSKSGSNQVVIEASDISAGANNIRFILYPAQGSSLSNGKATFTNVYAVKGYIERIKLDDIAKRIIFDSYVNTNILAYKDVITVAGSGNYVNSSFAEYVGAISFGDAFRFIYDEITGYSATSPIAIVLLKDNTEIRRVYGDYLLITESDVSNGANKVRFLLYPAQGTAMQTGKAVYTEVYALKGHMPENSVKGDAKESVENAITSSDVIFSSSSESLSGSGNYVLKTICDYMGNMNEGDTFSLLYDSVSEKTTEYPQNIYLYNGNTEIRHINRQRIDIVASDVTAGVNRIKFVLYPAKGTALESGSSVFTNVRCVRGLNEHRFFTGNIKKAAWYSLSEPYGDLPDYYFANNYLDSKVSTIQNLLKGCIGNGDVFAFITDMHALSNKFHSPSLLSYITTKCKIPRIFGGGDTEDHGSEEFCAELRKTCRAKIYHACGNHEWMQPTDGDELFYMMDMYNDDQIGNPFEHYYYVDNPQKKIRYVVLNAFLRNSDPEEYGAMSGYTEEQLSWFTNEALHLPDESWDVIIFTHYIGTYHRSPFPGTDDFINAMDAFNANSTGGKILFIMQGHRHFDAVWHTTGGIPIITTTCDRNDAWISEGEDMEPWLTEYRLTNTINEQAFEIVVVDRDNNQVKCVRIGCPAMNNVDIYPENGNWSYAPSLEVRTVNY